MLQCAEGERALDSAGKLAAWEGRGLDWWVEEPGHGKLNKLMPFLSGVELRITH